MESIIEGLAQYGPLGLWTASLLWMNWQQRKENKEDEIRAAEALKFHQENIAGKLDAIQEGECTALDNSMLMFCSSMLTGNHDASQLPVPLLGGAGGRIKGGRVLDYKGESERQMCRLYLSLMGKMEMRPARGRAEAIFGRPRFRCSRCGSKASAYFDVDDLDDPRAVARLERIEREKNEEWLDDEDEDDDEYDDEDEDGE